MYICMSTCVSECAVCMHVSECCVGMHTSACLQTPMHTHTWSSIVCAGAHVHACLQAPMYMCMCTYMCTALHAVHTCAHSHTHRDVHNSPNAELLWPTQGARMTPCKSSTSKGHRQEK
jgi:hypothetical protein